VEGPAFSMTFISAASSGILRVFPGHDTSRLRKKSEEQIPRGLKPARNDKNKGLTGTLRLRSGQAKVVPSPLPAVHEFFSKLLAACFFFIDSINRCHEGCGLDAAVPSASSVV
jgi:hypothetical protein